MSTAPRRRQIFHLLENPDTSHRPAMVINYMLITMIVINVIAVVLESVEQLGTRFATQFLFIEVVSIVIFTFEYALRVWTSVESHTVENEIPLRARLRYMVKPLALVDLVSIAPFYLSLFFAIDLRFLRVLRLLRLMKIARYFSGIEILASVLRAEARPLAAAIFVMFILMIVAASGMYLAEREIQPEAFSSIPSAMWWAMVTLTTVGYGDLVPMTAAGKIISTAIMILGIGMVALPAGMLASRFSAELHKRRERFGDRVVTLMADGQISQDDQIELERLRTELCLTEDEVAGVVARYKAKKSGVSRCPLCGKASGSPASSQ